MDYQIFNEDCLEGMKRIPDGSVDMILTDLPYGITACSFDKRIPFAPMWEQFKRVTKRNAAIVLFSQMPFGAELIMSNPKMFRYKWCWLKNCGTGFLNAKKMPLKAHEDVLLFYQSLPTYNPQFSTGKPYRIYSKNNSKNYGKQTPMLFINEDGKRYPTDVISYNTPTFGGWGDKSHPTQKPIDLLEYLIRTYSNEGETVLDATMGSGSTGVACVNTNRNFIGFELEEKFFNIASDRIQKAVNENRQRLF
ncbi:MAG: site-specific DNA-methyltransferase [Selenomonadaceae bacterium]|nr:site-specific DNA-methyltransferase [Selenomonadaceae bacterium]MBR1645245.1 site-specific DNA-methyltransferase [Selenomonadaceae bacterium]MBR1806228.1 site-specific DNA-methyltransferase [Selenomonadaceae bacterium]